MTAPTDRTPAADSVQVTGTSAPGNTVVVSAVNQDDHSSLTRSTTAGADGAFSVDVPLTGGTTVLNIVATSRAGGTARAVRTVVWDVAPGTLLFSADDPNGDDNGPGNYAYPTSSNFRPGAYDLERFEVYDAGENVIFRVRTRDLTPTFGSPLGAQLVDVYVHIPGASPTSSAAAFPQRNYTLATPWAKRIEVQGFGQQYVDASGATLGQVTIRANDISRYITFSVSKASLGTPAAGLGLHGRAHGPGRLQPRPGARLPADAAGVPVRRLRDREQRPALHRRPRHGAEGDRHADDAERARLHARARRALAGGDALRGDADAVVNLPR